MHTENQIRELIEGAHELAVSLSESQVDLFRRYLKEILSWNRRRNIVSRNDEKRIGSYHFIDSLSALEFLPRKEGIRCLDLGSGAGFPGIPIKIARPEIGLTLLEPKKWRHLFLQRVVELLSLENVRIFPGRAEDLSDAQPGYDVALVRAVAKLGDLIPMAFPLLSSGGIVIAYKSKDVLGEMSRAIETLLSKRARVVGIKRVVLPLSQVTRVFVVIEKS